MDFRHFLTSHHWWGKLIGACLGYLILGPVGALFGILIGNVFDRGLVEHISSPYWYFNIEKNPTIKKIFIESNFSIMGHLLKSDGRITEAHIQAINQVMRDMGLDKDQRLLAQNSFREGKKEDFDLWRTVFHLRDGTQFQPEFQKLSIDLLLRIAVVGGLTLKKQHILNNVLNTLGFAPLHQQQRFYDDFIHAQQKSSYSHHTNHSNASRPQYSSYSAQHAYQILGVAPNATKQEVKRAYRRLMSQNHPDKLIAKKASPATIKQANETTQQIRKAYEQICTQKGW